MALQDLDNPMTAEMLRLSNEITIEVERLNNEYNKFFGGAEKKPPVKLRDQLNKKADRLKAVMKQSPNLQTTMRVQNAVAKYNSYSAMWDKRIHKLETTGSSY